MEIHHTMKGPTGCYRSTDTRVSTRSSPPRRAHAGEYDYSAVPAQFVNAHTKVTIRCREHGDFTLTPGDHRRGARCPDCSGRRASRPEARREQFIERATRLHGNRYDYTGVVFIDQHTPVLIRCLEHGEFPQRPDHHTDASRPSGCRNCADRERPAALQRAWKRRPRPKRNFDGEFTTTV